MKITSQYKNIVWLYLIDSEIPWPTVAIFSWIHWDEISGIKASQKLLNNIKLNKLKILSWKLLLLIWANRKAIKENCRYLNQNLNRLFIDNLSWDWYEFERSRELTGILQECCYLLDLHSTSWPSVPYFFAEMKCFDFAQKLWVPTIVWWRWELNSSSTAWDTENYLNIKWWIGLTFESWDHLNKTWTKNAYQVSINYLSTLWMIDNQYFRELHWEEKFLKMKSVYVCKNWKFKFKLKDLNNFVFIKKGVLIGLDWAEEIYAQQDMILVMPNLANPKKWEDVFFVWELI